MLVAIHPRWRGLGDAQTAQIATVSVGTALSTAALFDPEPISKALLLIGSGLVGLVSKAFQGCGQTCVLSSDVANQIGALLQQNLETYLNSPVHTKTLQAQALQNFDQLWQALVSKCGQIGGQGGTNCVADRQVGACHWKTSPGGWNQDAGGNWHYTAPGPSGSGPDCWNWFVGQRDPIANDPTVVPDVVASPASTASTSTVQLVQGSDGSYYQVAVAPTGSNLSGLLVPALLVGLALVVANAD